MLRSWKKTIATLVALSALVCAVPALAGDVLRMATTTSTQDTGLLDALGPAFQKDTGIELQWTAVGTGKALKLGEDCNVDVLMVHAPQSEKEFLDKGFGMDRKEIFYNDFVIVGPLKDPAKAKGKTVAEALKAVSSAKASFVSRGDDSGTHKAELKLWKAAELPVPDKESWYISAGQGMLATLAMAAERGAYTLVDRGTWYKYEADQKGKAPLTILVEGDKPLLNQYSVMPVNPAHCPGVRADLAKKFSEWITSAKAQKFVGEFKVAGKPLFTPNARK
ncbi:MAG: substrate-binding domain-containing protein [Desulfovibrio aminophilus]|uniref:substrate-binding domain-containing protein n=1 Tax=Desulfovibrio aminophilus TaxID=81425 RepID=UPI0039EB2669